MKTALPQLRMIIVQPCCGHYVQYARTDVVVVELIKFFMKKYK